MLRALGASQANAFDYLSEILLYHKILPVYTFGHTGAQALLREIFLPYFNAHKKSLPLRSLHFIASAYDFKSRKFQHYEGNISARTVS